MGFKFTKEIADIKLWMKETGFYSTKRRLDVYQESIRCKKGCSACCTRPIKIFIAEALVLYDHLVKKNEWLEVKKKCHEFQKLAKNMSEKTWGFLNLKCPILKDDDSCGAYEVRPAICAVHYVTSNPKFCNPEYLERDKIRHADFVDIFQKFLDKINAEYPEGGIMKLYLPLPTALLIAESINERNNINIESITDLIKQEL